MKNPFIIEENRLEKKIIKECLYINEEVNKFKKVFSLKDI
jgi:hypothetical protein